MFYTVLLIYCYMNNSLLRNTKKLRRSCRHFLFYFKEKSFRIFTKLQAFIYNKQIRNKKHESKPIYVVKKIRPRFHTDIYVS